MQAHSRLAALLSELRRHEDAVTALEAAARVPGLPLKTKQDYETRLRQMRDSAARQKGHCIPAHGSRLLQHDHYKLLSVDPSCGIDEASDYPTPWCSTPPSSPAVQQCPCLLCHWSLTGPEGVQAPSTAAASRQGCECVSFHGKVWASRCAGDSRRRSAGPPAREGILVIYLLR